MSDTPENTKRNEESPDKVAIEGNLPLSAIDIESEKDIMSGRYHKLRSLHKWFAARPTPAARLAVLGSVYPGDINPDELLDLMQIGPNRLDSGRAEYVEQKFSQPSGNDNLDTHYDYDNPNTQTPTEAELAGFHEELRDGWGGELPTVLDPTAGRGILPFEALRYGLPTKANELNPIPSLITKVVLEYAPDIGSLTPEITDWRDKIHQRAKKRIESYYPTEKPNREIMNSAMTYLITCDACGGKIPLTGKWWLNKNSDGTGDAIQPVYENGSVEYKHVRVTDTTDYDPSNAPVSRGDAECPHPSCGVVTETEGVRKKIREGDFEYSIYGVSYETPQGDWEFRAGSDVDIKGMEKAAERVESDFEMVDFLTEKYPGGFTDRVVNYGVEEWRDIFTPRQLIIQYEYLQAYNHYKTEIKESYSEEKADAILTVLTFAASRTMMYNNRLSTWHEQRGCGGYIFADNNFVLKKMAVDNNSSAPRRGYMKCSERVINSYETLSSYVTEKDSADVLSGDAADLTEHWESGSVDVAVVDPPYYSSIQYAELSDFFYVLQKRYLSDTHPDLFRTELTDKGNEAVANPSRFEEMGGDVSKKALADEDYESKMQAIFADIHDLLSSGGVITVMFTHRDMDAWDTLTTAFIKAGFTITATHPIKTEKSDRVGMQGNASADSSILLIGRKQENDSETAKALWGDIKSDIQSTAGDEARRIIDSKYDMTKVDTIISAYGPTLQQYAEVHPIVNKKGEEVRPRDALAEARDAVTGVLADVYLDSNGLGELDGLTRWYILAWLTYESDTFPYDEGMQLGHGVGVDPSDIKRDTKIWGKSKGDIQLKRPEYRVQNIIQLRHADGDSPSSVKYPVNPTDERFTYTIDAIHSAIHVYEQDGPDGAWEWLSERRLKNDTDFETAVTTLLEVLPEDNDMFESLTALISGKTGEYLDIDTEHINFETGHQSEVEEWGGE